MRGISRARTALRELRLVDVAWGVFTLAMLALMLHLPSMQTLPYHLIFVSLTLLYGFRLWSARTTLVVLVALVIATGAVFGKALADGTVVGDEIAEVPLMPLIVGAMAWHALRSEARRRRIEELAALESTRLERQSRFLRETSHAIRTPVTIARGHVELMEMGSVDAQLRDDAQEVLHQLGRLESLAARLLLIETLATTEELRRTPVDLERLVATLGRRWQASAARQWVLPATPPRPTGMSAPAAVGTLAVDDRRLEEAVDAMVENALKVTGVTDRIRLSCRREGSLAIIEVADSGPGIPEADRPRVFERFFHRVQPGQEPGNGLGLALVAAVATAHGGSTFVTTAPEGGALVGMRLPVPSAHPRPASTGPGSAGSAMAGAATTEADSAGGPTSVLGGKPTATAPPGLSRPA